ncbi:MAG: ATP synthase F1 subunit delta [Deltaproteobacteria bacterium]|jgi:F-type H+-transporting ATPase subunit delta|nr:ATP synthase F1 subunit delta [Deltaproteobacteria bacterium]
MALASTASHRYADALVEAAEHSGQLDQVKAELSNFAAAMEQSFELKNVLLNPVFTKEERSRALDALMSHLSLSQTTQRFVRLVVAKDRIAELQQMSEVVQDLADAKEGRVRAEIHTASELSADATEQLRRALEKKTGKRIELSITVDKTLIGGIQAKVGSRVFDGTIRSELTRLRGILEARE